MDTKLKLDWANHKATAFACEYWHYSKSTPAGKLVKIGVWEDGMFKGVVIFSRGANKSIGRPYKLSQAQVCELTRIAMTTHKTPVTKIVSIAIKMLKKYCPELKLIVSYADVDQGHTGKIYKAGNWLYEGLKNENTMGAFIFKGKKMHPKTIHSMYGTGSQRIAFLQKIYPNVSKFITKGKHKYLYVLDEGIRESIMKLLRM
jgi:hypothetical protein